jgi:hypothetical protein
MIARRTTLLAFLPAALLATGCDTVTCRNVNPGVSASCLPDVVDVDREVRIELRETCGRNCARNPTCRATLSNGVVVLDVEEQECSDVLVNLCSVQPCQQRVLGCKLPPLPAGTYTLRAVGLADQLIQVRAGGLAGCQLANPDGGT